MPEGTPSPGEGSPSEVGDPGIETVGEDVVVHTDPVRIPFSALPETRTPEPAGSSIAMTFITGTAAAPWIMGAFITRHPMAIWFALGWGLAFALSLISDMKQVRPRRDA